MYHIKPDKRSRASADAIAQGLQQCLQTTPLTAVTIADLHRATGISRATFYRLFDTVEDVLRYSLDRMVEEFVQATGAGRTYTSLELLEQTIALGMQHHEFFQAIFDNGRFDLLFTYTEQTFRMPEIARGLLLPGADPVEREYILNQLAMSLVAIMFTWARNGRRETAAQIVQYMKRYGQLSALLLQDGEENRFATFI